MNCWKTFSHASCNNLMLFDSYSPEILTSLRHIPFTTLEVLKEELFTRTSMYHLVQVVASVHWVVQRHVFSSVELNLLICIQIIV